MIFHRPILTILNRATERNVDLADIKSLPVELIDDAENIFDKIQEIINKKDEVRRDVQQVLSQRN